MAKKKKQPKIQLLSPENYIRQKARNLPIHECLINEDWENSKIAHIVITRIHANGNVTVASYLVDLLCLGVKDTMYLFNVSQEEYAEFLEELNSGMNMGRVEYELVHNIIFATIEFASEFGFKPYKDFTSVTQYMLEEDNDDIELIEIECGKNEKPVFIKTPFFTEGEANKIINQLEKTAGKGNFDVVNGEDGDEMDFDEETDDDWGLDDEYNMMSFDEKIELFNELIANWLDDITEDDQKRLIALTDSIYFTDICDDDEVEDCCNRWAVETEMTIDEEVYTAELLSQEPGRIITEEEAMELDEIDILTNDKPRKVEKYLNELKKKWGNIAYLNYKELKYLELNKPKEYEKKVKDYCTQFSYFPLFKIEVYRYTFLNSAKTDNLEIIEFENIFEGRSSITEAEMFEFQLTKLISLIARGKINETEAMYYVLDDLELNENYYRYLISMLTLMRIDLLKIYLDKKEKL